MSEPAFKWFYSTSRILNRQFRQLSIKKSIGLAQLAYICKLIKLTSIRSYLCRADQNGCRAGSETEVVLEFRSAGRELVATPTATTAVAEADVVGSRKAAGTRGVNAGRSAIVCLTGASAEIVDSLGTVGNDGVQCITFGKTREVAERFTVESNNGVGVFEPVFVLFDGDQINLRRKSEQWAVMVNILNNIPWHLASVLQRRGEKK